MGVPTRVGVVTPGRKPLRRGRRTTARNTVVEGFSMSDTPKKPRRYTKKNPKPAAMKAAEALASILPMSAEGEPADQARPVLVDRDEQLLEIVKDPPPRPSTAAFLDHWFALCGGPAQFALDLRKEYLAAPSGSQIRQRIIEVVMRGMNLTDKKEGASDDMGLLTDDDLFRMMKVVGSRILADDTAKGK